jgi:hypothetical protein
MNIFRNRFIKILEQDESDVDPEVAAMQAELDAETNPDDLGLQNAPDTNDAIMQAAQAQSAAAEQMRTTLQTWIDKTSEFLDFLNSETDPNSIQSQLAQAEEATIMSQVKTSQQTKITRCASDLSAFRESLRGFLAQSKNPHYKYV